MKSTLSSIGLALALGVVLAGCQGPAQAPRNGSEAIAAKSTQPTKQPAQILVKFKSEMRATDLMAFRAAFGTRNVSIIAGLNVYVEEVTSDEPLEKVLRAMKASPLVEYAEPNAEVGIAN